jgi:hypothetical protein
MLLRAQQAQAALLGGDFGVSSAVLGFPDVQAVGLEPFSDSDGVQTVQSLIEHGSKLVEAHRDSDFLPLCDILIDGHRVLCGGSFKALCGSVYVEGKRCFFCESMEHESMQCGLRHSFGVGDVGTQSLRVAALPSSSQPSRLSFSAALARQKLERDREEEENLKKQQRVEDKEPAHVAVTAVASTWLPKASNKGWREYTKEPDKQFLQWAVYANDVDAVKDFIDGRNGAPAFDVDHADYTKQTAIHRAAQSRCIGICKTLIDYGCDYNAQDISGTSPILIFARDGNAQQLEAFVHMCKCVVSGAR